MSSSQKIVSASGKLMSVNYMNNFQKLHCGVWPWLKGLKARLPLHYKKRYIEKWMVEPKPVHYQADERKYYKDKYGTIRRVQNIPIPLTFPKEADEGLWGGEGIIAGLRRKNNNLYNPAIARLWKPQLFQRVFYSEILDKWLSITVTNRTMQLIDDAYGFDHYILKTHEVDLKSRLGMSLKRKMLLTLVRKSMYPNDRKKCSEIYDKYKEYVIPEEEAEWVGLSLYEAERKQYDIEEEQRQKNIRPLKEQFGIDLMKQLQQSSESVSSSNKHETSWINKLNPFQSKEKDDK